MNLLLSILFTLITSGTISAATIPNQLSNVLNNINNKIEQIPPELMHQFLQYAKNDLSPNITSKISPELTTYLSNPSTSTFNTLLQNEFQEIAQAIYDNGVRECQQLDLESGECTYDCITYNHPLSIFADNTTVGIKMIQVIQWYGVSGSPLGWYDVGNPDQCVLFNGKYCYTPLWTGDTLLPHGCCVPATCQGTDAIKIVSSNNYCFKAYKTAYSQFFPQSTMLAQCDTPERDTTSAGFIIVLLIFFMFVFLVIVASIWYRISAEYILPVADRNGNDLNEILNDDENVNNNKKIIPEKNSMFLSVFSIQTIWKTFTAVRPEGKRFLNFLDGIRVFSMSWVILGHSFMIAIGNMSNTGALLPIFGGPEGYSYFINKFYSVFIQYAFYSVDSFFWLSGLLGAFSIYRKLKKQYGDNAKNVLQNSYKWIPMAYIARYLRLAPMMMFVTAIQWKLSDQLPTGPHVMERTSNSDNCSDNWFKILSLTANLFLTSDNSESESCMGHLWYIQVDYQCYLLLPFLVLIFIMNKHIGIIASLLPFITSIGIRLYEGFYYHFIANILYPAYPTTHDANQQNMSYFQPWTRMSVYFIGVSTMFIFITINELYQSRNAKFYLNKFSYYTVMTISGFILCSLVMWPYQDVKDIPNGDRWTLKANEWYYALSRPMWGVGLSLLGFGLRYIKDDTTSSYKSIVKTFLSFGIYQPIGRLTYVMYLLHLIILTWWYQDLDVTSYYSGWFMVVLFIGMWSIVAMFTFILHIFMETPINNIITYILTCKCCIKKRVPQFYKSGSIQEVNEQNDHKKTISSQMRLHIVDKTDAYVTLEAENE